MPSFSSFCYIFPSLPTKQLVFIPEQIEADIYTIIEDVLKDTAYEEDLVSQWTDRIATQCLQLLVSLNKPYKFVGL